MSCPGGPRLTMQLPKESVRLRITVGEAATQGALPIGEDLSGFGRVTLERARDLNRRVAQLPAE